MKRYFRIYRQFVRYSTMKLLEFRADFVISLTHLFLFTFFNVNFYRAIYGNVNSIGGWTYPEMVVLIGTFIIIDALFFTFFIINFGAFDNYVRRAELDRILTKPVDAQFMATLQRVQYREFSSFFMGVFVLVYGLVKSGHVTTVPEIVAYIIFCLASLSIMYSTSLLIGCLSFYFEKAEDLHEVIISFWQFAKLPDVYRGAVKVAFMLFMPMVFASFVPAGIFFGKVNPWFLVYYLAIAVIFFTLSRIFWKISLKRYKSAGG